MDADEIHLWAWTASALAGHLLAVAGRHGRPFDDWQLVKARAGIDKAVRAVHGPAGEAGSGPWTPALAHAFVRAVAGSSRSSDGVHVNADNRELMHHVNAIRVAHALTIGRRDALSAEDEAVVRAARDDVWAHIAFGPIDDLRTARFWDPASPRPASPPRAPVGAPVAFPFRHSWVRTSGAVSVPTSSVGVATMIEVPAADAPVVCRLATPDGGHLDVRVRDGAFLRPVTSPGSWAPIGTADFLEAVAEGVAWADNPFDPVDRLTPPMGVRDLTTPEPRRLAAAQAAARDAVATRLVGDVGTLVVVDGSVHRSCPPPMATFALRGERRLSWHVPGQVAETDDPSLLRLTRLVPVHVRPGSSRVWDTGGPTVCTSVPLTRASELVDVVGGCFMDGGESLRDAAPTFQVLRPDLWPEDPGHDLDALAAVGYLLTTVDLRRTGGAEVWAAARTAAAEARAGMGGTVDPVPFRHALDLLGGQGDRVSPLLAALIERVAPSPGPDLDDEVAGLVL